MNGLSGLNEGTISWRALTGQSVVNVNVAKPQSLTQAVEKRSDLDQSHRPDDEADLSSADRMEMQEQKTA
ncbi:hypothetical protein ACSTJ1_00405, partial [Vibrio parahaemolyticus]